MVIPAVQHVSHVTTNANGSMGVMTIVLPHSGGNFGSDFFEIVRAWSYGSTRDGVAFICRRANIEPDTGILHSNLESPDRYRQAKITRKFELGDGLWLYRAADCLET